VVTTDLFYGSDRRDGAPSGPRPQAWRNRGAVAVEMEAATLFTLGRRIGAATACLLTVSDLFEGDVRFRIEDEELAAAAEQMGAAAVAALSDPQP
jgi:uridine phosphorylase